MSATSHGNEEAKAVEEALSALDAGRKLARNLTAVGRHVVLGFFEFIDRDFTGQITEEELNTALNNVRVNVPDSEKTEILETGDIDRDGSLNENEYLTLLAQLDDQAGEDLTQATFGALDTNGDGLIGERELQAALDGMGVHITPSEANQFVSSADGDGDFMVSGGEFYTLVHDKVENRLLLEGSKKQARMEAQDGEEGVLGDIHARGAVWLLPVGQRLRAELEGSIWVPVAALGFLVPLLAGAFLCARRRRRRTARALEDIVDADMVAVE